MKIWVPKRPPVQLGLTRELINAHRSKLMTLAGDFDGDTFFEPHFVNGQIVSYDFVSEPGIAALRRPVHKLDWPTQQSLLLPKVTRVHIGNGRFA